MTKKENLMFLSSGPRLMPAAATATSTTTTRCPFCSSLIIEMKGITRCKLTIISESAVCKKFLGQIVSYPASL
jgi:hypothetical protein